MGKHKFDEAVLESNKMLERNINSGYIAYWKLAKIARYQGKLVEAERFYTLSKENAQEFYDRYCTKPYDLSDIDGKCSNRYDFLKDFEKKKAEKLEF